MVKGSTMFHCYTFGNGSSAQETCSGPMHTAQSNSDHPPRLVLRGERGGERRLSRASSAASSFTQFTREVDSVDLQAWAGAHSCQEKDKCTSKMKFEFALPAKAEGPELLDPQLLSRRPRLCTGFRRGPRTFSPARRTTSHKGCLFDFH